MKSVWIGLFAAGFFQVPEVRAEEDFGERTKPSLDSATPSDSSASRALTTSSDPADRLTLWNAPPTCIALHDLRGRVKRQITGEPSAIREVRGEMLRGPAGWIASFTVYDADTRLGERVLELSGEDCRTHDATLALVVALLLEHGPPPPAEDEGPVGTPEPEQTAPAEPEEIPEPEEPRPSPEVVSDERAPALRLRAGLGFQAVSGWLPSLGWGPTTFVGAEIFERASVELALDYYLGNESAGFEEATVKTTGGRIHLRGCVLHSFGNWGTPVCLGVGWIAIAAVGQGVPDARSALHGSFEASGSLGLTYRLNPHFGVEAGARVTAPARRGRFVFQNGNGQEEVHTTSPVLFATHVGVVLTL